VEDLNHKDHKAHQEKHLNCKKSFVTFVLFVVKLWHPGACAEER
jgi:hypothetical protein